MEPSRMKQLFYILLLFTLSTGISVALAQKNPAEEKAKKILDALSKKTRAYKSIQADFTINVENKANQTKENQNGKILLKGKKYRIETAGQVVINDTKTIHTVLKDASEVQISNAEEKEKQENAITPSNLFTIYEKGFKYEYFKEEKTKKGKLLDVVKLYPTDPKKKNYHTLIISIDKVKTEVYSFKMLGKDGTETTYTIKKFTSDAIIPEESFQFNAKNFSGYEIIDLR